MGDLFCLSRVVSPKQLSGFR